MIQINGHLISDQFIQLCYKMAENGLNSGEVPVGCVFVYFDDDKGGEEVSTGGRVVASGHNRTNECRSGIRH